MIYMGEEKKKEEVVDNIVESTQDIIDSIKGEVTKEKG